jgi:hypothetical protein
MKKKSDPDLDPEPDPLVRGTDPGIRIRIRTKMSRIPNTEKEEGTSENLDGRD